MIRKITQLRKFIEVDLWRLKLKTLPKWQKWFFGFIRVWIIAVKEFIDDRCTEKASALTYFSMLSIVPVLAMIFAIGQVFGIEKLLEEQLTTFLSSQEEMLQSVLPLAQRTINSYKDDGSGSLIAIISILVFIFTIIRLLMNIENAFNNMWNIKKSRRWERKISDYVAVILLGPILLIAASTATFFVTSQIQNFITDFAVFQPIRSGIFFLLKLLPYTLIWVLLFLFYLIFPNTRVKFFPALMAGILAGTLYQLTQWGFINLQFAFARYNAIYGSIVFIPLFLIWLQLSWLIVLFGAEFAYGAQYVNEWTMGSDQLKVSVDHKRKLMLLLLYRIIKKFESRGGPMQLSELAEYVNIPRKIVVDICNELEKALLISKVESETPTYLPSFDINKMNLHMVIQMYDQAGIGNFDDKKTGAFKAIEKAMVEIDKKWKGSEVDKLLKEL